MIFYILSQTRYGKVDLRSQKFNREDVPTFVVGGLAMGGLMTYLTLTGLWPAALMFAGVAGAAVAIGLAMPKKE